MFMQALTEQLIAERLHQDARATRGGEYAEMDFGPETVLKCAAVLVPLIHFDEQWHVLYTRRTDRVELHKGQVSFPGGACNEGETTPEQTALREAEEEVGIRPGDVRVLGRLNAMITVSSFRVVPIVGIVASWPYVFSVGKDEVARVFTIPLNWLADQHNRWEFTRQGTTKTLIAYHPFDGELLWGATARMTVEFLAALGLN